MTADRYSLKTQRGYDFFEVTSALQKEIRRGNDEDAVYWAMELIPKFETYLWKRLKVIANEDIGIAEPTIFAAVEALASQYFLIRDTLCVVNAVMLMARAKKTRLACHLSIVMEQSISQNLPKKAIPDYALDKHTRRGKEMGRDLQDHFRKVGALLNNEADVGDKWQELCYRLLRTKVPYKLKANGSNPAPEKTSPLFDPLDPEGMEDV